MLPYKFFLGGADLEMAEIRRHLERVNIDFEDAGLQWGAKASAYVSRINEAAAAGFIPVLVELELDCQLPESAIVVDHHGARSGEPASLLQVLNLLEMRPSRWDELVAANDAGWFPGLIAVGATAEEMDAVLSAGRKVKGITAAEEAEIERALAASVETIGDIRIVRMSHSKTGGVGDRLAIPAVTAGLPIPSYLVLSEDGEANFSGPGDIAAALNEKFPGGFCGGAGLGKADGTAFWGSTQAEFEEVEAFLQERFGG